MAGQLGLDTLIDVATNGKSEYARVQAGLTLMDRAWGKSITPVEMRQSIVTVSINLSGSNVPPPSDMIDLDPEEYLKQDSSG